MRARPAPTTRTGSSALPTPVPDSPPPAWPWRTPRWACSTPIPNSGSAPTPIFRGSMYEFFAQDGWKATQKLHIDYGVRYTVIVPYKRPVAEHGGVRSRVLRSVEGGAGRSQDRHDRSRVRETVTTEWSFRAPAGRIRRRAAFPKPSDPSLNYLFRGVNDHYSDIQWNDIQPRLGIAYQITPKTVIRARRGPLLHAPRRQRFDLPRRQPAVPADRERELRQRGQSGRNLDQPASADGDHAEQGVQESRSLGVERHGAAGTAGQHR